MIRCIAMDDEPLALGQIGAYIKKIPYFELVAECADAYEAMNVVGREHIDAVFADINMPDLNGLDFVRSLSNPPLIVFTTAYSSYAVESYQVEAVDYLLKPFGFDQFLKAADKLKHRYELMQAAHKKEQPDRDADHLYVKTEHRMVRINISQIKYVEGMSEYVRIYIEGEPKPVVALLSMKKVEETLPKQRFMRVHKSYIVNLSRIVSVNKTGISMDADNFIPVGDTFREALFSYIDSHALSK